MVSESEHRRMGERKNLKGVSHAVDTGHVDLKRMMVVTTSIVYRIE